MARPGVRTVLGSSGVGGLQGDPVAHALQLADQPLGVGAGGLALEQPVTAEFGVGLVVAAELTQDANDVHQLEPMLKATAATLAAAGIEERPEALLADSGYWSIANLTGIPDAPELLIPPAKHGRQGKARKDGRPSESNSDGLRAAMTAKLTSEDGKAR
jgi:hypothetical protein